MGFHVPQKNGRLGYIANFCLRVGRVRSNWSSCENILFTTALVAYTTAGIFDLLNLS